MMIPAFLHSLAALIRQLLADGKAVYVNEQTAKELELLAGLSWDRAYPDLPPAPGWNRLPTPADIALGWLVASRALPEVRGEEYGQGYVERASEGVAEDCQRAAACAELAVIAVTAPGPWYLLSDPASMHTRGTREGARAAWEFIVDQWGAGAGLTDAIDEHYRRELEAMK